MTTRHELALLQYLFDACGDKEAVDAAKSVTLESIQAHSIRSAFSSFKHALSQGIWPTPEYVFATMDPVASNAVKFALRDVEKVFQPQGCLDSIQRDWEQARAMEALSKGFHDIRDGGSTVADVMKQLRNISTKTDGWEEWDFADVLKTTQSGAALDPHIASRNLLVTGIESIDQSLASPAGVYGVIGAMPGVGKTSLMFQAAVLSTMSGTKVMAMSHFHQNVTQMWLHSWLLT